MLICQNADGVHARPD